MMNILMISPFYSPNIGGVETHLDDLVSELDSRGYKVVVHSYSPITTPGVKWKSKSAIGKNSIVYRHRWFGKNLFHFVENHPLLDFLYLTPYLLLCVFIYMLLNKKDIDVIHAHGLNAALIGVFLKKIFKKRLIVSTHAVYKFNSNSTVSKAVRNILTKADKILCVSSSSQDELIRIGIDKNKMDVYKQWINLDNFSYPEENIQKKIRNNIKFDDKFSILFVGRLIKKKGAQYLCEVATMLPNINFVFIGSGPLEYRINNMAEKYNNIKFIGKIKNNELNQYYQAADLLCVPSQYEEGFPRVPMEAVSCGLPVIASNIGGKGGLIEMLNDDVAIFIEPTIDNIKEEILALYNDSNRLIALKKNCKNYALSNFSKENINFIMKHYKIVN